MFNPQFGFTFRSHNNPTNISDLYSSRVANLLRYSLNHSRGGEADWRRMERDIEMILKMLKR